MMRLIQYCNVGNIVGGTAACAWSVTRALPDFEHVVLFRSQPTLETRQAFEHCKIAFVPHLTSEILMSWRADVLILHNISPANVFWGHEKKNLPVRGLQYIHSAGGSRAGAARMVCCSESLKEQLGHPSIEVLTQGVPVAVSGTTCRREQKRFVVGRICTPVDRKWPTELLSFYDRLVKIHPQIDWAFVGCPKSLEQSLREVCCGRAVFHRAEFNARKLLRDWHALVYHHPSLTESFGRTVAEAMRCGCVPVVDNKGGFREQIIPGAGYLCGNVGEFSAALEELLIPERWISHSQNCQSHADGHFSLRSFRQRLLSQLICL
ncbi:MAG TPA: hypothetical protein DD473_05115 [Planctomycetaceae bacterium]|nr:hypothetical protein [Planctomycetaceae bacterium]